MKGGGGQALSDCLSKWRKQMSETIGKVRELMAGDF